MRSGSLPQPWKAQYAARAFATIRRPLGERSTFVRQLPVMFQSSVTSWSSKIMYVGVLASSRRTRGSAARVAFERT
jgi:hypothetical protein